LVVYNIFINDAGSNKYQMNSIQFMVQLQCYDDCLNTRFICINRGFHNSLLPYNKLRMKLDGISHYEHSLKQARLSSPSISRWNSELSFLNS